MPVDDCLLLNQEQRTCRRTRSVWTIATSGTKIPETVITGCEGKSGKENQRRRKLGINRQDQLVALTRPKSKAVWWPLTGGTGRTLHPDNMGAGPASYGMTDTMGRMHSDAQFAGSSSVPAHVEMMGFLGMGNNPMVGASVAVAVALEGAMS